MKKIVIGLLAAALIAPAAFASGVSVNAPAALNGTGFGLDVDHDNLNAAYVEDRTPADESVYRFEMLTKINSVSFSGAPANFRQMIAVAIGPNPRPDRPECGAPTPPMFANALRAWHYRIFAGTTDVIEVWLAGDFCGDVAIGGPGDSRFFVADSDTNTNGEVKLCVEMTTGSPGTGRASLQDEGDACFSGVVKSRDRQNAGHAIQIFRMGVPGTNFFGAGETVEYFMDEFASFRTLAP